MPPRISIDAENQTITAHTSARTAGASTVVTIPQDLLNAVSFKRRPFTTVQEADLQPVSDAIPCHIALDKTVTRINLRQFWLYAAVDPETNGFPHVRLFTTTTTALTQ
jgi:hypothetical protein